MIFVASLLLFTLPQVFPGGDIKLPPRSETPRAAPQVRPLTEIERFRRDLIELQGPQGKVEQKLQEMAAAYQAPVLEALILEVARSARANEMNNLMVVVRRFATNPPSAKVGDELLFQLLVRPLGEATRPVVEMMVALKGEHAKEALRECIRGRHSAARRPAVEAMVPMLATDDLDYALELSREQSLDLQLRGIDLLQALPGAIGAPRLIELLSKDPVCGGAACAALIAMGEASAPALRAFAIQPPIDRGFAYACFALARIAETGDPAALPDSVAPALWSRLQDPDPLTRCLAAVCAADFAFRSAPGAAAHDVAIVEGLLQVVEPQQPLSNLELLGRPAAERLLRLTGRIIVGDDGLSWRAWWKEQKAGFTGVRSRIEFSAAIANSVVVTWRHEQRHVRLLAEGLADVATVGDATEVVLTKEAMFQLVNSLLAAGFADEVAMRVESALPRRRSLAVQGPTGRAQVTMPVSEHPRFDALVAMVQACVDAEAWQLYRDPATESDRGAFWRTERAWREANPDATARGRRFLGRVVSLWPKLSTSLRARAIEQIVQHPERKQLLGEADGERVLAMLETLPQLTDLDLRLLELAASAPGDRIWRAAVELANRKPGGGAVAVRGLFAVLGPDAVLGALHDPNPAVRCSGIEEIMVVRDQRAAPRLVELLADPDLDVRRVAAAACGHLQIAASARGLVDLISAADTTPLVRRECLRALGRVGGDLAFPVLQRALLAKAQDDKDAAMRGLGDLHDPRAAHVLADLFVLGHGKDLGTLARLHLLRQTGTFAIPAVRSQLQIVQEAEIRDELVLLLGAWHDAAAVPELMDLLRKPQRAPEAASLLEGTTGVSFAAASDRIDRIESWYREQRTSPQWTWLLDALRANEIATSLRPEHFAADAGLAAVPDLARLLVEVKEPRLWSLVGAVLRTTAREDFGMVSMGTPLEVREAIAARYRQLAEVARAAKGR